MASYYVYSGAGGAANGTSWVNAYTTLTAAFSGHAAGDTYYVAHDHAESTAAAITLASSGTASAPTKVVCVNRAGSVPPVSADRRTTAQVTTTGASNINFNSYTHYDGIIFTAGNGAGLASVFAPSSGTARLRFDNCSLRLGGTSTTSRIGNAVSGAALELNNTTVSFGAVAQGVGIHGLFSWRNTPSALLGTIPTTVLVIGVNSGGTCDCVGVDFSAAGSGKTICGNQSAAEGVRFTLIDCKLDAAVTKAAVPSSGGSTEVDFIRSGASGVNYNVFSSRISGTLNEEITIVRTGGASDGTTAIAWKIDTTANCTYSLPFECPPIAVWNDTTGSSVTATVEGIWGGGAVPLDTEIWLECEYLGSSSSPLGSFVADCAADLLTAGANQTSSSETWGGSTTKFKLSVSFTPQMKGWVYGRVKCGKASSTFYVDPKLTLS